MKELNWVSLGCGVIAHQLAQAMEHEGRTLYGVANRTFEKAVSFADQYKIPHVYQNIDDAFLDPEVDVIYISTPHNTHMTYLRKALANGKHVLCEKSITLNSAELDEAMSLATEHGVILAEAMTIYHMPIYKKLKQILDSGELGELRMIQMNFGSYKEYDMSNRFFNRSLAGGALLDIGVYALSFIRWFMSLKPDQVLSQMKPAPSKVDEQAGILLMNANAEMAVVSLSLHAKQPKRGMVSFDKGYIEIYEYPRADKAVITYTQSGETRVIEEGSSQEALVYELRDMEEAVRGRKNVMQQAMTKDVMDLMTKIRTDWGLFYPEEE